LASTIPSTMENNATFPPIKYGGCLPLAWQLKDLRVILVGGGQVAVGRLTNLLQADALVTIIAPSDSMHPEILYRISEDETAKTRITWVDRKYAGASDLMGDTAMVLTAINDHEESLRIWGDAKAAKIPVNVADVPPNCDFYFGSLVRRGPLQIMISTNGRGPKLASLVKDKIEGALPDHIGAAIENTGKLRVRLRERVPGVGGELGQRRMKWVTNVCEAWSFAQLGSLEDEEIDVLLDQGWEKQRVPRYEEVTRNRLTSSWRVSIPKGLFGGPQMPFAFGVGVLAGIVMCLGLLHRKQMFNI
jgi:precorrin-2 dehydrogenase / sirohydrochlorin ferrochelatase